MLTFRTFSEHPGERCLGGRNRGTKEGIPVTDGERIEKKRGTIYVVL